MAKFVGLGAVLAGAAAGIASSAVLYFVIVGLLSLVTGSSEGPEGPSLVIRAWHFATIFGLLSGAHWAFAAARRRLSDQSGAMLVAKILCVAMVALGVLLVLTGSRWDATIGGLGGQSLVLVVAWLALTHFVSKALEKQTSEGKTASTA